MKCGLLQGNINLIEAAAVKGVKKFVLVTSIGTGDSKDAPPTQVYDVLKPVLLEKEKAEEALKVRTPAPHTQQQRAEHSATDLSTSSSP
jgi:nucleoside-diphosphate-sugar epimerase